MGKYSSQRYSLMGITGCRISSKTSTSAGEILLQRSVIYHSLSLPSRIRRFAAA